MKSQAFLASILFLSTMLAGCAGDTILPLEGQEAPASEEGPETEPTQPTTKSNATVETPQNVAPVASLMASAFNGTAPLLVNFTLNGTDADGDNLTWIFSVNGTEVFNGTELPAEVNYTFEAGNFTVDLTVSDGNMSHVASLALAIAGMPEAGPEPIVITGSLAAPVSASAIGFGCLVVIVEDGIDGDAHSFDTDVTGWHYDVTTGLGSDFWVYWWSEGVDLLEDGASGTVPAGYSWAEVCVDLALPLEEYTLTLTPPGA